MIKTIKPVQLKAKQQILIIDEIIYFQYKKPESFESKSLF